MTRPSWSEKFFFEDASIDSSFSSQSSSSEKVAPPNFSTAILFYFRDESLGMLCGNRDAGLDLVILGVVVHVDHDELLIELGIVLGSHRRPPIIVSACKHCRTASLANLTNCQYADITQKLAKTR